MVALKRLLEQLKEGSHKLCLTDFVPYYQYEKWHKAKISPLMLRLIRKEARKAGIDPTSWGCPQEEPSKPLADVAPRGKVCERLKPYKQEYIQKLLVNMPEKIAQWKAVLSVAYFIGETRSKEFWGQEASLLAKCR